MAGKTYNVVIDLDVKGDQELNKVVKNVTDLQKKSGGVSNVFMKIGKGVKSAGLAVKGFGAAIAGAFGGAVFSLVTRIIDAFVQMEPVAKALEYAFTFIEVAVSKAAEAFQALLSLDFGKFWDVAASIKETTDNIIDLEKAVKDLDESMASLSVRMGQLTFIADLHKNAMNDTTRSFKSRREQAAAWYEQMKLINEENIRFLEHEKSLREEQLLNAKNDEARREASIAILNLQQEINERRRETVSITIEYNAVITEINAQEKERLERLRSGEEIELMQAQSTELLNIKQQEQIGLRSIEAGITKDHQKNLQTRRANTVSFVQAGLSVLQAGFAIAEQMAADDFEKQKQIRIANVVTNTLMGIVGAWAGAFMTPTIAPAQLILGAISSALMIGVGAYNISQINSSSPSGGGSVGGGSAASVGGSAASSAASIGAAPSFGLINPLTSGEQQIGEAVSGQAEEPIKAYVVSDEVTSQQELDRATLSNATI